MGPGIDSQKISFQVGRAAVYGPVRDTPGFIMGAKVTIYIDHPWNWPGPASPAAVTAGVEEWCHLMIDAKDPLDELHKFAERIGFGQDRFCNRLWLPHYDLIAAERQRAVDAGAVELTCVQLIRICKRDPILQ